MPDKPGPKGPRKLTGEVMEYIESCQAQDPSLRSRNLAVAVTDRFGFTVHPRSVERALARHRESAGPEGSHRRA